MVSKRVWVSVKPTVSALLADMASHPGVVCVHSFAANVLPLGLCATCQDTLIRQGWKRGRA